MSINYTSLSQYIKDSEYHIQQEKSAGIAMRDIYLNSLKIKKKLQCRDLYQGAGLSAFISWQGKRKLFSKSSDRLWCPRSPPFQLITQVLSTQVKRPARVIRPLTVSRTKVKNEWSSSSITLICFHGADRNNFAFYYDPLNNCVLSLNLYLWNQSQTQYLYFQNNGHF